jgi:hypothetical protein
MPERSPDPSAEILKMSEAILRHLRLRTGDAVRKVSIRLFWPVEDKKAWDCRWEINWPDRQRANSGRGLDAMQALLHAIQMIGAEIHASEEHRSGRLDWSDEWKGYGFPVSGNIRDLLVGDDAKYF